MSFDDAIRRKLAKMVAACRSLLTEDATDQLRGRFGIHPDGTILPVDRLDLDEGERAAAEASRELLDHFTTGEAGPAEERRRRGYDRLVLEISFTALNRLAALRLCEERGLVVECVRQGTASDGFRLFERVTGGGLGTRYQTYRVFLDGLFDELALDLGILFDRTTPQSAVFPSERCLDDVLAALNKPELAHIWADDETIGWIYQYFNRDEDRRDARYDEMGMPKAPQNSYELAIRNQFFTPRYVVEFLTDNTLGRIWYEMRRGDTALKDECLHLVRRPNEVFLPPGKQAATSAETDAAPQQAQLVKQPFHIAHRPKMDPRDLRMLDPACGSGHFLLYGFNLFGRIYEEAWQDSKSPQSETTGRNLREDFETLEDLRRAVPKLVIECNLHGIDIDPRATQIAALALWLRAHKSWKALGVKTAERPRIERSNIVTAEPMPGEEDMRREFTAGLTPRVLGQLVDVVFSKMQLAGEAGPLLKIEEEIKDAVASAKAEYVAEQRQRRDEAGYLPGMAPQRDPTLFDFADLSDLAFWEEAEDRIVDALKDYADRADNGRSVRRRLFTEDACRGFAFIDLCRKRYDVIVMNPPFGDLSEGFAPYGASKYSRTKYDLGTIFIERIAELAHSDARCGWITSRTWMASSLLDDFRRELLYRDARLELVADFGIGVLDALVETAACVLGIRGQVSDNGSVLVYRLLASKNKEQDFRIAVQAGAEAAICAPLDTIELLPRAAFGYWLPRHFISKVTSFQSLSSSGANARQGLATTDDFRFLRTLWEVPQENVGFGLRWVPLAKGGEYEPYYDDLHLVIDYENDGRILKTHLVCNKGQKHWSRRIASAEYYGRPGLTYPERTTSDFSPRPLPGGSVFTATGQAVFFSSTLDARVYLGLSYSRVFKMLLELFVGAGDASESGSAARHYTSGILNDMPVPELSGALSGIGELVNEAVLIRRRHYERDEITTDFVRPSIFSGDNLSTIHDAIEKASAAYLEDSLRLLEIGDLIDREAASAYGLQDRTSLDEEVCPYPLDYPPSSRTQDGDDLNVSRVVAMLCERRGYRRAFTKKAYWADRMLELLWHYEGEKVTPSSTSLTQGCRHLESAAGDLVSYVVGLLVGRWDLRLGLNPALGSQAPDAFVAQAPCARGLLLGADGFPARSGCIVSEEWLRARPDAVTLPAKGSVDNPTIEDAEYPLRVSWEGILVDDAGANNGKAHPEDIVRRVREVLDLVWKDNAGGVEQEACAILGAKNLRDYICRSAGFFQDHLKRYSKSRRKAPIYWPLSTGSGSYTIWLYYQRLTDQTLYAAVNNYLDPKITNVENTADHAQRELETASGREATRLRDRLNDARALVSELRELRDELLRIAALPYRPNLNDGVIINAAPFYKLFRLRSWAKTTEQVWRKLEKGDYDWAHLAYTIWPERVKQTCRRDRSVAIAHGLESLCEVEAVAAKRSGKRTSRKKSKVAR